MNAFVLSFFVDGHGDVELQASIDTPDLKGRFYYWCPPGEFADLIEALSQYPLVKGQPIELSWYADCITFRLEASDSIGGLYASITLCECIDRWDTCRVRFRTTYGDIDRFRDQLAHAITNGSGDAVLRRF